MLNILNLTENKLMADLTKNGIRSFRYKQILHWIYKKYIFDFQKMSNLPEKERSLFRKIYNITDLSQEKRIHSKNNETVKFLFKTGDDLYIESVHFYKLFYF